MSSILYRSEFSREAYIAQMRKDLQQGSDDAMVDRSETCFSGKGDQTVDEYINSVTVAAEVHEQLFW